MQRNEERGFLSRSTPEYTFWTASETGAGMPVFAE